MLASKADKNYIKFKTCGGIRLRNEKTLGKNTDKHLTVIIGKSLKLINLLLLEFKKNGRSQRVLPTVPTPWPCVIPQSDQILSPGQQKGFLSSKKKYGKMSSANFIRWLVGDTL